MRASHQLTTLVIRRALWLVGLMIANCSWPPTLMADESVTESAVRSLVRRLDADRKTDRQQAEDQLLNLGPGVLVWLPEPESLNSPAAVEAVRRVRAKLERQKAESFVEASRLKHGGAMTIADCLRRLNAETGNVVLWNELPRDWLAESIQLPDRSTFWDSVEALCRQPQRVNWLADGAALRILPAGSTGKRGDVKSVAVAQSKAFRLAVNSISPRMIVGQESSKLARVEVSVTSEPRLRPLLLKVAADDWQFNGNLANGEQSELWPLFSPGAKLELTFGQGQRRQSFPLDFRVSKLSQPKSISLRGKLLVETAAAEEPLDFPPGAECRGVSRRRGGVAVRVLNWESDANSNGRDLTIRVSVIYDRGGPAFESHRSWMLSNVAGLRLPEQPRGAEKSESKLLNPTQHDIDLRPDGTNLVVYRFENLPRPADDYRFRYVAPTLILDVPLDVEFRDIRWPAAGTN